MSAAPYWIECVTQACEGAGVAATEAQILLIAEEVQGGHEMYSEAMGHLNIPNPLLQEIERLRRDLKREQGKRVCGACRGNGLEISCGPYHDAISTCSSCHGEGKK